MGNALVEMPLPLAIVLLVVLPTLLACTIAVATRPLVAKRLVEWHYDVMQGMYAGLGVMYALIAAFLVVVVWEQFSAADSASSQEAAALVSAYRDTEAFPTGPQHDLRARLRDYTLAVVDDEWARLQDAQSSPRAVRALDNLYRFYPVSLVKPSWEAPYTDSFARLDEISVHRSQRLLAAESALPDALWWLLIFGAFLMIGFSYFFYLADAVMQVLATGFVAALTTAVLLLILLLTHPFSGHVSIPPDVFRQALDTYRLIDSGH